MKRIEFIAATALLISSLSFFSQSREDEKIIEEIIINSYIHGLIDAKDFEKAKEGIHEGFIIWGHRDTLLTKKTRDNGLISEKSV